MPLFSPKVLPLLCLSLPATLVLAQGQASSYNDAAQVWTKAAASCRNPVAVSCMMRNASYYRCLAGQLGAGGGGSCSAPTCSTSCAGSTGSLGSVTGAGGSSSTLGTLGKGVGAVMALKGLFGSSSATTPATATDPLDTTVNQQMAPINAEIAAEFAAKQQQDQINNDAANILQQANSLVSSGNSTPGTPNLDNALEINNLLGDDSAPDASSTVASLLGNALNSLIPSASASDDIPQAPDSPPASGNTPGPSQDLKNCVATHMTNIQDCLPAGSNGSNGPSGPGSSGDGPTNDPQSSSGNPNILTFNGDGSSTVVTNPILPTPTSIIYNPDGSGVTTYPPTPTNPNGVTVTTNKDGSVTYSDPSYAPKVTTYNPNSSVIELKLTYNPDGSVTYPKLPLNISVHANP